MTHMHVRVHRMLAKQVDPEFLARFREPKHPVERDDIGENPSTLVVMYHVQKLQRHVSPGSIEPPMFCQLVEIIYPLVLMMQCFIEQTTPNPFCREHALDKRTKIDVSMVQL